MRVRMTAAGWLAPTGPKTFLSFFLASGVSRTTGTFLVLSLIHSRGNKAGRNAFGAEDGDPRRTPGGRVARHAVHKFSHSHGNGGSNPLRDGARLRQARIMEVQKDPDPVGRSRPLA